MVRITGDTAELVKLAQQTNSLEQLYDKLKYLHAWGECAGTEIQVDMRITKIDLERKDAEIYLKFYSHTDTPGLYRLDPEPIMNGGLNLCMKSETEYYWSVNT